MNPAKKLAHHHLSIATILAFAIVPLSGMATDIYVPSLPAMAAELHTSEPRVQLTISLFLISYGLSQIIAGGFLDAFGRYRIGLVSLVMFTLSCFAVTLWNSLPFIYSMRVVQGICTGFIIVAKRAFFVDVYQGEKRKHRLSAMTIVWSVGPIIAPFIGGYLEHAFGWRSCFRLLGGYCGLICILELFFSGETILQRHPLQLRSILAVYGRMLRTADFLLGLLVLGTSYAMIMVFSLSGPFIIEHQMGFSAITAGYVALILGLAWMCGGFAGKAMIDRNFMPKMYAACIIQLLLVIAMMVVSGYVRDLRVMTGFAFAIHITAGFMFNNYFTYCLGRFPEAAGMAGGLTGGLAYTLTSVLSYEVVNLVGISSQATLSYGYLVMSLAGIAILLTGNRFFLRKQAAGSRKNA